MEYEVDPAIATVLASLLSVITQVRGEPNGIAAIIGVAVGRGHNRHSNDEPKPDRDRDPSYI